MAGEAQSVALGRVRQELHGSDLVRAVLGWCAVCGLLAMIPQIEMRVIDWTVASLVWLLRGARVTFGVGGTTIASGGAAVRIVGECTSLLPCALVLGAVITARAPWWYKAIGLVWGFFVLWAFNLIRIAALLWVLARAPALFDAVHLLFWQTMTTAIMGWILWSWLCHRPRRVAS